MTVNFEGEGPFEISAQTGEAWAGSETITLAFRVLHVGAATQVTMRVVLLRNQATELLGSLSRAIGEHLPG